MALCGPSSRTRTPRRPSSLVAADAQRERAVRLGAVRGAQADAQQHLPQVRARTRHERQVGFDLELERGVAPFGDRPEHVDDLRGKRSDLRGASGSDLVVARQHLERRQALADALELLARIAVRDVPEGRIVTVALLRGQADEALQRHDRRVHLGGDIAREGPEEAHALGAPKLRPRAPHGLDHASVLDRHARLGREPA